MTIKLEVGKTYKLNNGEVHECTKMFGDDPLNVDEYGNGPFIVGGYRYHMNGVFSGEHCEKYNVASCVDDTPQMTLPNGDTLSEGDYGVTRDGRKVGPLMLAGTRSHRWDVPSFDGADGEFFNDSGLSDEASANHLVAKWVDTPTLEDGTPPEQTDYNDGKWYCWNGGKCPVHRESEVEVAWSVQADISAYGSHRASSWNWNGEQLKAFRVTKPYVEPKVETVTLYGHKGKDKRRYKGDWNFQCNKFDHNTHRITFNLIDGKPECDSVKMEEI